MNKKMVLRNNLRSLQMSRSDNVTKYLMRITQENDQLVEIGEKMEVVELMNVELNGLPKISGTIFQGSLCSGESPRLTEDLG
jgi:hypothetical protein